MAQTLYSKRARDIVQSPAGGSGSGERAMRLGAGRGMAHFWAAGLG